MSKKKLTLPWPDPPPPIEPRKCECNFTQMTVGDGCSACNPEKRAELVLGNLEDLVRGLHDEQCCRCGPADESTVRAWALTALRVTQGEVYSKQLFKRCQLEATE